MNINVTNKNNGKDYRVYDITYDKAGYPHFLIYNDGQWIRMSAKHFKPYDIVDLMKEFNEALNKWSNDGVLYAD